MRVPVRVWLGFAALCFMAGSRWLQDAAVPSAFAPLVRQSLHAAVLFMVLAVLAAMRREWGTRSQWLMIAGPAALVFVIPDVVIAGAAATVTGLSEALVFTLVPVVVVFAVAQQATEFGVDDGARRLVGPALAGVMGAGLMIPFTMPATGAGKAWLGALVVSAVAAGLAAVRLHTLLMGWGVAGAAMAVSGVVALAGGVAAYPDWRGTSIPDGRSMLLELLVTLLFDGSMLLLAVWLLRELPAVAFSARYLVILLTTITESYLILRPAVSWYVAAGALMMVGSVTMMLWVGREADSKGSPVR